MIQIVSFAQVYMISPIQICDYGDYIDGQCLTTTTAAPETTTTAVGEDIGELIIIRFSKMHCYGNGYAFNDDVGVMIIKQSLC